MDVGRRAIRLDRVFPLFAMAFVDLLAPVVGPISPMNIVRIVGLDPSNELKLASFIAIFTGFSVSLSAISVQTYINKRVPMLQQGRVFGLQSMLANAAALIPLLLVGIFAEVASIKGVLLFAPWIVLGGVYVLLVLTTMIARGERPSGREVFESFWEQPEAASETLAALGLGPLDGDAPRIKTEKISSNHPQGGMYALPRLR